MAKLVSSWSKDIKSVPNDYILPPEQRPQLDIPFCDEFPVIDLSLTDRVYLATQIIKALEEFTAFQVINHGIGENLMEDGMEVSKEFFKLGAEDKEEYVCDEIRVGKAWVYTGTMNFGTEEKIKSWVDGLVHPCYPVQETINSWPHKPLRYREVVAEYANGSKKVSEKILELIAEGIGMEKGYFAGNGKLSDGESIIVINHHPTCPDPSLTIGLKQHNDPTLLTMIQQDNNVYGLQIYKHGKWIAVKPLPNAFLVLNGQQLEVISNGRLRSGLSRVLTNAEADQTSISFFVNPDLQSIIEPANAVLSDGNPPKFRGFTYWEFIQRFHGELAEGESALSAFQL